MKRFVVAFLLAFACSAGAETNVVNGVTIVCEDGVCRMVDTARPTPSLPNTTAAPRLAQGYIEADDFLAFLENRPREDVFAGKSLWLVLLLVMLGGLAMNLTPCVLPMIPVNLMIIGKSARRGAWYGLGMMLAYGTLGVLAALGGSAFGGIQANPWFNLAVALVFLALALSLFGVFFIDFSKARTRFRGGAFLMGMLAAVLAGACVAPILIAVLLLTARLFAAGNVFALGLPFVLGFGMALPWPFVGAGLAVLPRPGRWMAWVNRFFGVVVLGFAAWYGVLAYRGLVHARAGDAPARAATATPETFATAFAALKADSPRPVLVDCWATWCKNCTAMDRRTLADPRVRTALEAYSVLRLQAEDMAELRMLPGFEDVMGLPAFLVFE